MSVKRKRNLFDPNSTEPFPLSRSKMECFTKCPRCFYLDRRLGVQPPGIPALVLNSTVGRLLEHEFDFYRERGEPHPVMLAGGLEGVVPYKSDRLLEWRLPLKGIRHVHQPTNILVYGAPDDIWVDNDGELIVCDYKATASKERTITMDTPYRMGYIRQLQIYRWLLVQSGYPVSGKSYLVFANAVVDRPSFDRRLDFDLQLVEVKGDTDWIEPTLIAAKACLMADEPPAASTTCENCGYVEAVTGATHDGQRCPHG